MTDLGCSGSANDKHARGYPGMSCTDTTGLGRSLHFASAASRILMKQQLTLDKLKKRPFSEREVLTARLNCAIAQEALDLVLDLKGYYIKAAQTLCGAGQLPKEMDDAFAALLDQCPKESPEVVQQIIEEEFDCQIKEVFREFDFEAVAAASIGQVHFATTKDGTKVAVKVQYPEVEKFFKMDIRMVSFAMQVGGMGSKVREVFKTMEAQFEQEFDYTSEASVMREIAKNLAPHFRDRIVVPMPLDSAHPACQRLGVQTLCTRKVLTMERLEGTPIREYTMQLLEVFAKAYGTTAEELKKQMAARHISRLDTKNRAVKAAMNQGEVSACQTWMFMAALKLKNFISRWCSGCLCFCQHGNYTGLLTGVLPHEFEPLNGRRLARLLYDVHGHEIFQNGLFNSDPHAGNVLALKDGRLGLIDYGAVMRLTEEQRTNVAKLFVAIADEDDEAVPPAFWKCGFKSKRQDPRLALLLAHMFFNRGPFPYDLNRLAPKVGLPMNPDLMTLDSYIRGGKLDEIEEFPGHLVMLQRCAMVLSGIAMELGAGRLSSAGMLKPQAVKWLQRHTASA